MTEPKKPRRKLTISDHLKTLDALIARQQEALAQLRLRRLKLIEAHEGRMATLAEELKQAKKEASE